MFRVYNKDAPLWLSLDIDSLDSEVIKATGTPVKNGLTTDQLGTILDTVLPDAIGMDLAELNFDLCDRRELDQ